MTTDDEDVPEDAYWAALETVVNIAFDWCSEYGFSDPLFAQDVWDAAKLLRPDLEPGAS